MELKEKVKKDIEAIKKKQADDFKYRHGGCDHRRMLEYLTDIQKLQRKAAGKITTSVYLLRDSGAIFGGIVREPQISIDISIIQDGNMQDYFLYQFNSEYENDTVFLDFKKTLNRLIKDFDDEWNRRRRNYIKSHLHDCV